MPDQFMGLSQTDQNVNVCTCCAVPKYKTSLSLSFHICTTGIAVPTSVFFRVNETIRESSHSGLSVQCFAVTVVTTLHH